MGGILIKKKKKDLVAGLLLHFVTQIVLSLLGILLTLLQRVEAGLHCDGGKKISDRFHIHYLDAKNG